jgi:hypothetical protein
VLRLGVVADPVFAMTPSYGSWTTATVRPVISENVKLTSWLPSS